MIPPMTNNPSLVSHVLGVMAISERIRAARGRSGLTMRQVASECGVSAQLVFKWESGASFPNSSCLIAMCRLFDCSAEWLMDPRPLDFHSTESAPDGKHAKYWVREALNELEIERLSRQEDPSHD